MGPVSPSDMPSEARPDSAPARAVIVGGRSALTAGEEM